MVQGWKSWLIKILGMFGMSKRQETPIQQAWKATRPGDENTPATKGKHIAVTRVLQPAYTRRLRPDPDEADLFRNRTTRRTNVSAIASHVARADGHRDNEAP